MKILITGAAGFIGTILVQELHKQNIGHITTADMGAVQLRLGLQGVERHQIDLRKSKKVKALCETRYDVIIHLAAFTSVGESVSDPTKYLYNNITPLLHLLNYSPFAKFIIASTASVYMSSDVGLVEDDPLMPESPYGISKLITEQIVDAAPNESTVLRFFNVAGASGSHGETLKGNTHLIPSLLRVAYGMDKKATVNGKDYKTSDGTCLRDYVHILDVVHGIILAINGPPGIYNLGGGIGHTTKEIIDVVREVTGHAIPTEYGPRREGDPAACYADITKANNDLNWAPIRGIVKTVTDANKGVCLV